MIELPPPQNDERLIFDLQIAHVITRVTELAVRLGLFEQARGPLSVDELARRVVIGKRAADVLVTALAALGLLERSQETVSLTPMAREYLLIDSPFYKGWLFQSLSEDEFAVMRSVHLQDQAAPPITSLWLEGKVKDPDRQADYMHSRTFATATGFARDPFFSSARRLLDVAGGTGTVSIALALRNSSLECVVMDLAPMEAAARSRIAGYEVPGRVSFVARDMFRDPWPDGCDVVLFSNIFHDWDVARQRRLAGRAFDTLPSGGHVLVSEMLLNDDRTGPLAPALFSMLMLVGNLGRQLTFRELEAILAGAGFRDIRVLTQSGYYVLVVGRKP